MCCESFLYNVHTLPDNAKYIKLLLNNGFVMSFYDFELLFRDVLNVRGLKMSQFNRYPLNWNGIMCVICCMKQNVMKAFHHDQSQYSVHSSHQGIIW